MLEEVEKKVPELVRDLMSVGVYTCSPDTTMQHLSSTLLDLQLDAAVILDDYGHAIGTVSRTDLVKAFANGMPIETPVEQIMDPDVPTIPPDIPLKAAAQLMLDRGIRSFYLTHHAGGIEYPAALITYQHLLRLIAMKNLDEIGDLGIKASRRLPLEVFLERREAARNRNKPPLHHDKE